MIKNKLSKEKELNIPEFLALLGNNLLESYSTKYHLKPFLEKIDEFFKILEAIKKDVIEIPWDPT